MTTELTRPSHSYGPAMMALSNDRQRNFVVALVTGEPGHGCLTRAYLAAGYEPTNRKNAGKAAHELSRDERIIAAIAEESRKTVRVHHPEAAMALLNLIRNPEHKDHARAVAMVLDRVDPVNSHHSVTVTHKVVDPDQEGLLELKAARHIGATREKLIELFGPNGLERLERLERAENAQRAASAKLIEGTAEEVKNAD
jgi:phage terminase small subunit